MLSEWNTEYFNWRVQYGVYSTSFSIFEISLSWENSGYMPRVNGKALLKGSVSLEAAEYAVVLYLQKIANRILDKFPNP
jgi:hypothetical protein